jgi:hypothetical protein
MSFIECVLLYTNKPSLIENLACSTWNSLKIRFVNLPKESLLKGKA